MIKNYLTVAFRNLIKHKFYSSINILGLAVGLTCVLYISLYVKEELSYDSFHPDIDQIFRVDFTGALNGTEFEINQSSAPAGRTFEDVFPEVIDHVRIKGTGNWFVQEAGKEQSFKEEHVAYADSNLFNFFNLKLIKGNPNTCLNRSNTLVINQSTATKIFGNDNPIGKIVRLDSREDYEVTGVFEDMPRNSHFHFDIFLSMEGNQQSKRTMWLSMNLVTYIKLAKGADAQELESKFPGLVETYIGEEVQKFMNISLEEFKNAGNHAGFFLFPMKDIHLFSDKQGELEPNGDINYIYIFSAIAILILALACINFMNLATARSAGRAKEVGLRKVMGAYKSQLVKQFLAEAFLLSAISFVLALGLSSLFLSQFNVLADKELMIGDIFSLDFLIVMFGLMVAVSFVAGSYPSLYLAKFRPAEVLKGKLSLGFKGGSIRSILVVTQFTVSIMMMVGTAIVYDQLGFIQDKKLGFDKEQVLMIHDAWILGDKVKSYKNTGLDRSQVSAATIASFMPIGHSDNNNLFFIGANPTKDESYVVHNHGIDYDYIPTLGMEIVEGRNFSKDYSTDSLGIILNEAAVKRFGFKNPIGQTVSTYDGNSEADLHVVSFKIIGVVKDFHYLSLRNNIDPLVFQLGNSTGYVSFKLNGDNISETISYLRSTWDEFAPGQPFAYSFLDERFNEIYESEQQIGKIFGVFAFLAIFIACMGMFGLASFTTSQKTKEIGIRKVLGAPVLGIVTLLSKDFIKLILISFFVATPVSYYFMNMWLEDFAFRIDMNPFTFMLAGVLAIGIALLTMSFQSIKAARVNPVNSLRDE